MTDNKDNGLTYYFKYILYSLSILMVIAFSVVCFFERSRITKMVVSQMDSVSDAAVKITRNEFDRVIQTAHELCENDGVRELASGNAEQFTDSEIRKMAELCPSDCVVIFEFDGSAMVLKEKLSDEALQNAYSEIKSGSDKAFIISDDGTDYICYFEAITSSGENSGYVLACIDLSKMIDIWSSIDRTGFVGLAFSSGDEIIWTNVASGNFNPDRIKKKGLYYSETESGLPGYDLIVFCGEYAKQWIKSRFSTIIMACGIILLLALRAFSRYWDRHVLTPVYKIISGTNESMDRPLPLTGEGYFDNLVKHINDMIESERNIEKIETNLLKKQINAHFTVNTLNALRALINKDDKKGASDMCEELSALLRYANTGDTYISLFDEFYHLSQYTSIMKVRNPGRLETDFEYDDSYEEIFIPRMIIQPVVENSIVHGIGNGKGTIRVYAEISDDVKIIVEDDGKGMSEEELDNLRTKIKNADRVLDEELKHVALSNIQKRIDILYGGEYGLYFESKEGSGTVVTVRLPLINEKPDNDGH